MAPPLSRPVRSVRRALGLNESGLLCTSTPPLHRRSRFYPALAANLASQRIQSAWRGFALRKRRRAAADAVAAAPPLAPPDHQLSAFDRRFLAFIARHRLEPSAGSLLLLACLRLQAWWRMQLPRRRAKRLLFAAFSETAHTLACSIQGWFRDIRAQRRRRRKPRSRPYAAWLIQRAWTRHIDRRTYRYFRGGSSEASVAAPPSTETTPFSSCPRPARV